MTRRTSSIVVLASSTFRRPSSNIVTMPLRRASRAERVNIETVAANDLFYGIVHRKHLKDA